VVSIAPGVVPQHRPRDTPMRCMTAHREKPQPSRRTPAPDLDTERRIFHLQINKIDKGEGPPRERRRRRRPRRFRTTVPSPQQLFRGPCV